MDFLATGQQPEVSAQALGLLAALAPQLVADRLNALCSVEADDLKAERIQWAIVDALATSPLREAAEWLQRACRAPFRSVRLKAGNDAIGTCILLPLPVEEGDTRWDFHVGFHAFQVLPRTTADSTRGRNR